MSTFTQIIYQIIIITKRRENVLTLTKQDVLFSYVSGILKNKNCHVYTIGGIENHFHIITHLHPSISLADLVKDIKLSSSRFIKSQNLFPGFSYWQPGYGAFTYSINSKETLIRYARNQIEHHKKLSFNDEYKNLLKSQKITFDDKYLL